MRTSCFFFNNIKSAANLFQKSCPPLACFSNPILSLCPGRRRTFSKKQDIILCFQFNERRKKIFNFYLASLFVIGLNAQQIKWASQFVASAVCLQCGPLSSQSSLSLQITPTRVGWGHRPTLLRMNVSSKTNMAILTIWRKIRLISGFSPFSIFQPTADRIPQRPRFQPWRS